MMTTINKFRQFIKNDDDDTTPTAVRWIETRGCMTDDFKITRGFVTQRYFDICQPSKTPEIFLEIKLENGEMVKFPEVAFTKAKDGVLEYRF